MAQLENETRPAEQPEDEKRSARRFSLDLPIAVKFLDNGTYEVTRHTRDVSSHGVFFYVNSAIDLGTQIELVLTLPSEITLSDPIRVRFKRNMVRVDKMARVHGD